jgi:drug/metabolite transporter (DMT)-like permease
MWRIWLTALLWGLNWPAVKILLDGTGPWTLRAAGLGVAATLLAGFTLLSGRSLRVAREYWQPLIITALLSVAAFNICSVFAQLTMPTSRAAILTFTMPLWAALFAWIWLGEPIDRLRAVALTVGAIGLGVLAIPFIAFARAGGVPYGLAFVLGAAMSWAAGTVNLKRHPIAADPLASVTWQVALAAAVCAAGVALFETPRLELDRPIILAAFAYHAALPQAVAYVLWFATLARVSASTASLGTLLIPVFAVLGAITLLDDWPSPRDLAGFGLILAAVVIDQTLRMSHQASDATTKP